ncbi:YfcL family protein [Paraglaciecola arctica]|uniref:YfcL family protein n=1 Tax=Paraglaciecola arctica TaxID=1128911 RepID=UPI001C06A0BC|nr:YfcL family protein [Paraglaciecola arctica]MBU3004036.1 YfcL family protein [Paraglaciecola arctica]
MTIAKQTPNELTLFIKKTEKYLDQVVENGSDQELFIASYLQGHFAVAAGQSQVRKMTQVTQLNDLMETSLDAAFDNNELDKNDQHQVLKLWQTLLAD